MDDQPSRVDWSEGKPLPNETHPNPLLDGVVMDVGLALDALYGISFVKLSLSMSKFFRKKHRILFTLRLHQAPRLFIQAQDAVVIAPHA